MSSLYKIFSYELSGNKQDCAKDQKFCDSFVLLYAQDLTVIGTNQVSKIILSD